MIAHIRAISLAIPFLALACGDEVDQQDPKTNPVVSERIKIRISGFLGGHLEPCGCASGQLGGLARRAFSLQQDRDYDLLIEGGGLVEGDQPAEVLAIQNPLETNKLMYLMMVLSDRKAPYSAIGLARQDLEIPLETLGEFLSAFAIPTLSSDLKPKKERKNWPVKPYLDRDFPTGSVRLASLILELPERPASIRKTFDLQAPQAAWQAAMKGRKAKAFRVLMAHGTMETCRSLAKLTPKPDLIIAINGAHDEPPNQSELVDGVPLVHPGTRGRHLLDVKLARSAGKPQIVDYKLIKLSGSKTAKGAMENSDVRGLLTAHRGEVAANGLREALADLTPTPNGQKYLGSESCMTCHESAYASWKETRHGKAWKTLETVANGDRYDWDTTRYPDCVKCHSVGYGQKSGFINPEKTPGLAAVGCEQCHGPGEKHAKDPAVEKTVPFDVATCLKCHNSEQTPEFDYARMWKEIAHGK